MQEKGVRIRRKICEEADEENVVVRRTGWYGPVAAIGEKRRSEERKAWKYS